MNTGASKYIAAIVLFLVSLALFINLTFPTEALKKRVESEIENNTGFDAEITSISVSPFLELPLTGLNLDNRQKEISVLIDKLKIKPSLLSLFFNNKKFPFDVKVKR